MWIRKDGAFPALVETDVFEEAQAERAQRHRRYSDAELLDILREVHAKHGKISAQLISNHVQNPTPQTFKYHFGTLANAYAMAKLNTPAAFSYVESRRALREIRAHLFVEVARLIDEAGGTSAPHDGKHTLRINGAIILHVAVARCQQEGAGNRWRFGTSLAVGADFAIVAKLNTDNRSVMEFYLLRMSEHCGAWIALPTRVRSSHPLDGQRFAHLAEMFRR
jgi:hypothetical protein